MLTTTTVKSILLQSLRLPKFLQNWTATEEENGRITSEVNPIYVCIYVCVCVCVYIYIYIYILLSYDQY
jgi:hypothetical protein